MNLMRHEDRRLITGTGKFSADWNLEDQLHAAMVRSDRAHAEILSVDVDAAIALPGVIAVYTAADVTGSGFSPIPSGPDIKGINNSVINKNPLPLLAIDRVRFVGQAVAMVVAISDAVAHDAIELVEVTYRDLTPVTDTEIVAMDGSNQLHTNAAENVSLVFESGDQDAVEQAFAVADRTTTLRIDSQRLAGAPMELRTVLANFDANSGKTVVYTPTQGLLGMRASLAAVTGLDTSDFEIVTQDVGGSFGLRGGPGVEHGLVILAAHQLGRPVKWVARRSELFIGEWHGRALTLTGSVALDSNDNITALRFDDVVDLGAYNCYFGGFIGSNNLSVTMGGAYRIPALYMQSKLMYTNKVPVSAYRGAGRPDIAFAIERLIDQTAAEHNLDPVEFRRKNFIPAGAFPYTTANGTEYDSGDFEAVMDKALSLSDYQEFEQRRDAANKEGKVRGIGIGYYVEKSGAGSAPKDQVSCRFNADGTLTLFAVTGPSGQGHETTFAQIVGDGLGLDPSKIDYQAGVAEQQLVGNGTGGSRSLYGTGSAFKKLVDAVIEKVTPYAAQHLDAVADDLIFEEGQFLMRDGAGSIHLTDLVQAVATQESASQARASESEHPFNATAETSTGANYPNGCHIAECELDPETGVVRIVSYTAVDDLGNVINPELVRGQVQGGVVQGAGQAFTEAVVYDDSGQLLSGSFMDYAMPRAGIVEKMVTDTYAVPTKLNELGSKGVGESGCSGSLPALSNAMSAILRDLGAAPMQMPYTPHRVWQHLQN